MNLSKFRTTEWNIDQQLQGSLQNSLYFWISNFSAQNPPKILIFNILLLLYNIYYSIILEIISLIPLNLKLSLIFVQLFYLFLNYQAPMAIRDEGTSLFSQSVRLTQYVVLCPSACLPVCLSVPVSFWRGFSDKTNIYHCWGAL